MKTSLIIPAYNEEKYLGDCLRSVAPFAHLFHEVIVVNNASTDKTKEVAQSFPFVRVADETRKGLLWARQRGFDSATGDLLAYIDADCRLPAGWFEKVAKAFEDKDLVGFSGPYRYYDLSRGYEFFANLGWKISAPLTYRIIGYMMLGGNFVARKDALAKISGFNTGIAFYGEDTDLARRLHAVGKVVFDMDFFVYSSGRRLMSQGIWKIFGIYGLNYVWEVLFKKPLTETYEDIR